MYILGQIGAIMCHERGPRPATNVLTTMASRPAEGLTIALAEMHAQCPPRRGHRRTLLQWKQKEIQRLRSALPDTLPTAVSAQTQMPFWAGYCQYWEDMLKPQIERDIDGPALTLIDMTRGRAGA
ncbi:putative uncharacterized protein (plasmid) [Caballeronia insecticola]|uniref:Uncharacterized protein n=2 Tax=Caballeronia insecticola TaxID=758793 RepID=R4WU93_9BURK|nr:putative uncharacterized protein [Caballeronia insecticola]